MKFFAIAFLWWSFAGAATAQPGALGPQPADVDVQRRAIAQERDRLQALLSAEDAACYQKFAVNNCLENVNSQRLKALAELRKQEIKLNDEDRKNKGDQQLRSLQQKSLPEKQMQESQSRAQSLKDFQGRQEREKESPQKRNAAATEAKANREANAARLQANQKKIQARVEKQASAAEDAKKFNARQVQANERRAQHAAEQAKRTKPAAKPLPIPQ
jgi:colicin import membrane protein